MTGQLSMWDPLPAPKARRSDPEVSKEAARYAERFQRTHMGRILEALRCSGPATAHELCAWMIDRLHNDGVSPLTVVQIDRRRKEMVACGWVRLTGEVRGGAEVFETTDSVGEGRAR